MAISTYQIYLMKGSGSPVAYSKLVDIKSTPDLGGDPEMLETTTLSDGIQTFIPGILSLADGLPFTANYTKSDYTTLNALADVDTPYAVWFGADSSGSPDGHDGKFSFNGKLRVYPAGGGVNEVVDMNITIAPSTVITFA